MLFCSRGMTARRQMDIGRSCDEFLAMLLSRVCARSKKLITQHNECNARRGALMLGVVSDLELTGAPSKVAFSALRLNAADELFCYFLPLQKCKSVRREQWFMAENENDTCGENLSTVNQRGMSQKLKCERREQLIISESIP
jgi:hypothetical protein